MATGQHRRRHTFLDAARQAIARYGSISRSTERLLNNRPDRVGYDRNRHNTVSMLGQSALVMVNDYGLNSEDPERPQLENGWYYGKLLNGLDVDLPGTADLDMANTVTFATRDVLVFNMEEDFADGSRLLQPNSYHVGFIVGISTAFFPGKAIVAVGNIPIYELNGEIQCPIVNNYIVQLNAESYASILACSVQLGTGIGKATVLIDGGTAAGFENMSISGVKTRYEVDYDAAGVTLVPINSTVSLNVTYLDDAAWLRFTLLFTRYCPTPASPSP